MSSRFTIILVFLMTMALARSEAALGRDCLSSEPSGSLEAMHQRMARKQFDLRDTSQSSINIDTYMHVIADNETYEGGWLNDTILHRQMEVLNAGFNQTKFSFVLKGIDRTITQLPKENDILVHAMFFSKLRRGDYQSLNLYYAREKADTGSCTFPSMQAATDPYSLEFLLDGCSMGSNTTPGSQGKFSTGKTTIHEVGHWFGLLHTFRGGCNSTHGDYIDDTPFEAELPESELWACPLGRNSCPNKPGSDPIHNYMDYTSDACRREFTPGQIDRMEGLWKLSRDIERVWNVPATVEERAFSDK